MGSMEIRDLRVNGNANCLAVESWEFFPRI
jgi:hypothetical protein